MAFTANLSDWDALLQDDYVMNGIVDAINTATPFRDKLRRVGMTHGRRRLYPIKVGASQGQGARAENAAMPRPGAGEYQDVVVTSKYNYAPFRITGQAEAFSSSKAFADFGVQIVKDNKEGLRLFTGRQSWGDGQGILALVNGALAAGASTATVDSAYGVLWGSMAANTTLLIKRNMIVQFGTEDNGGAGYLVTAVTGTTFTFSPVLANAVADNATISNQGSANLEIEGMLKMTATAALQTTLGLTTTYHGINRTTYPEFEGNVVNAGASLSLTNIRTTRDTIYKRTDDEESNLAMCGTEVARDYEALLTPAQRLGVTPMKLEGGHTVLEHDGLRWAKDSKAPAKALFFADTNAIAWAQTGDPHWQQDGSGITRVISGQDAKEALLKWYSNLDCDQPRRLGMLYNLTVS